jgi:peptide/nickel transport system substrate-binding protein
MNRRDRAIIAALVLVMVVLGGAIGLPRARPAVPGSSAEPTPEATPVPPVTYREGVVGSPLSITPVTARTRADRTLVGLVFSGLLRPGPSGSYQPDLAESWTANPAGTTWTVTIRADATWHDGAPVTAEDVVYTVEALKNPDAAGGAAASWAEVTVTALGPRTVQFTLATPLGGFLAALCQPLLPAHLLDGVPFARLAESNFARHPVGTGPFALLELDGTRAVLEPAAPAPVLATPTPGPSLDSLASPFPVLPPRRPVPYLERIEVSFYETEAALAEAVRLGEVDGAAGFTPAVTADLAATGGIERLRYPTTTLSAVLLNLRPSHPELRDPAVRRALLAAIDRDALVSGPLDGDAVRADALVPPGSWAFDAASAPAIAFNRKAASAALTGAGWTKAGGKWATPKAKAAYRLEVISVPAAANPRLAATASFVRDAWVSLGFEVSLVEVPAGELATRLRAGRYAAAVVDISAGLEPDLYPLLASSQVRASGTNLSGYQDPVLDTLLEAARAPGPPAARTAAWKALLAAVGERMPILPIAWMDEVFLARGLEGPAPRLIVGPGDRFGDVLAWRLAADR